MKLNDNRILLILLFIFAITSSSSFGQSNEIKIRFIGNCGLHMTDGDLNIYVDFPYKSGAYGYMEYDKAELDSIKENSIFIFTHKHADHYSGKKVRKVIRAKNGKKFTQWKTSKLEKFSKTIPDFDIQILKTKHRFSLKHRSYLISWHGKRIYFSGDTENAETISEMNDLDWAFVPPWIFLDAKEKDLKIDAENFGVYHLYPDQKVEVKSPDKIKLLDTQGELITIPY